MRKWRSLKAIAYHNLTCRPTAAAASLALILPVKSPGCTTEAQGFRDSLEAFQAAGVHIIGISKDSVKRHDNFKAKYDLNFTLASDEDGTACNAFGVWVEKKNYGRTYMGIERSTFLINSAGVVAKAWTKVRVKGHVDAVLEAAEGL